MAKASSRAFSSAGAMSESRQSRSPRHCSESLCNASPISKVSKPSNSTWSASASSNATSVPSASNGPSETSGPSDDASAHGPRTTTSDPAWPAPLAEAIG
eukprot:719677-Alexandrium_andersonii.AAC.1